MRCTRAIRFILGVAVCLLASACRKSEQQSNLRERIEAANFSQYCHPPDGCFNPEVLAVDNGFEVTTFLGSRPQHGHVPAKYLGAYLNALPMQAWPRGAMIGVGPTDDSADPHTVEQNFEAARQLCGSMGLEVRVRPGG